MNFSKKQHIPFATMLILFVAMGLVVWFAILPIKQSISQKMDDIQKFYTSRENRDRQISKLSELEQQFGVIQADEEHLNILLKEDRIVDFVKTLEGLARETNTEISIASKEGNSIIEKKVVVGKPQTKSSADADAPAPAVSEKKKATGILDTLPFDRYLHLGVSVVGEYADIINFLHKMETLPFALDVVGMEMHQKENEERSSSSLSVTSGSGINPFVATSESTASTPPLETPVIVPEEKNTLEAVFDTIVYVDKK